MDMCEDASGQPVYHWNVIVTNDHSTNITKHILHTINTETLCLRSLTTHMVCVYMRACVCMCVCNCHTCTNLMSIVMIRIGCDMHYTPSIYTYSIISLLQCTYYEMYMRVLHMVKYCTGKVLANANLNFVDLATI